ncbi:MAG: hypothetical protein EXS05_02495 [Planctomycetaceae bacterium]|nr:hypothetical protein [Planctomycetaceae bacterium]
MPDPLPLKPSFISDLSNQVWGRSLSEQDAAAVAGLLNGLNADMQAFRKVPIADGDEPATTYSAVEGEP